MKDEQQSVSGEAGTVAHTPGPWALEDRQIVAPGGVVICDVLDSDDFPCVDDEDVEACDRECAANAALIAAGPQMLAALRRMVDAYEEHDFGDYGVSDRLYEAAQAARAAIQSATAPTNTENGNG